MITLYFKEGTSDKVYQVSVDAVADGYDVNFAYGRRGSTMNTGKKNTSPLSQGEAQKIADKLVKEKMAKGYTPGPDGTPYKNTNNENRNTGIYPMLLNAIPEEEISIFVMDANWILQNKYDGKRMIIRKQDNQVDAINRSGLLIGAPQHILDEVAQIPGNFILDGEAVGEKYIIFDMIENTRLLVNRLEDLRVLMKQSNHISMLLAPNFDGHSAKAYQVQHLKDTNHEGVVFKHKYAPYTPGRPATGGVALKCKFTATANVWATMWNVQRSVQIRAEGGEQVGNVTIPVNKEMPPIGSIIEVRYLYAIPGSNALYQPVYSRLRDDINAADKLSSLKYKKEED
jgi:bifunctional non-homologous end joining protein LigD